MASRRGRIMGHEIRALRAMLRLKADLHTHCADDPCDLIRYSAEMLIDAVAQLNIEVLGIACHLRVVYNKRLGDYALRRGVLLIPATELHVEGKHVVALNPDEKQAEAKSFAELRRLGKRDAVLMAPHPFYPTRSCLHRKLVENIDLFGAIEYSSVYLRWINPNRRAVQAAQRFGLPLIGTSDTHAMPYCSSTYSWIEAEEASIDGVMEAIRRGRVTIETQPRPIIHVAQMAVFSARDTFRSFSGLFR
jgi:hypothetical protein